MTFDRRDFFGVIAAPLLRKLVPPVPMAKSPIALATIGGTISGPVRIIDVTTHSINAAHWRKQLRPLLDAGDLSFDIHFEPPNGRL